MSIPNTELYSQIKKKLTKFKPKIISLPEFKQSAVLMLLIPVKNSFNLVFTTRSRHIHSHQGQMSFPGGRFDSSYDDDLQETALRETAEEIGVNSNHIEIIGQLNDLPITSGYIISPFVGLYQGEIPVTYSLNPVEVADLVEIPIDFFLQQPLFQDKIDFEFTYQGFKAMSIFVDYINPKNKKTYHIWGATAHITAEFFKICFDHHLTKPEYSRPPLDLIIEYLSNRSKH
ncbi:CoA pyrophosphatase [Candidatus Lokiarchaeum ossiferum]|uniref:CoA pyrophosphatase n=1 Tax=Candidatus Lokiarchaeum ossiferum TaxID=2951803 RepID=UPI00352E4529